MDKMTVWEYIQQPDKLDNDSLAYLEDLVNRYPYFAVAQCLYVRNLKNLHHRSFETALGNAALHVPARDRLFAFLDPDAYVLKPEERKPPVATSVSPVNRADNLIDSFLTGNQVSERPVRTRGRVADVRTDYIGYLLQMEEERHTDTSSASSSTESVPRLNHQDLIDDFIGQGDKRIVLSQEETVSHPEIEEQSMGEGDCFTETLAKIYIKQGRYEKAIEIIRKLSLKNPKKNCYFADQIRFLEKLIINNKNK